MYGMKRVWIIKEIVGEASDGWKAEDLGYEFESRTEAFSFMDKFCLKDTQKNKADYIVLRIK